MKKIQFTETQIVAMLKQHEQGVKAVFIASLLDFLKWHKSKQNSQGVSKRYFQLPIVIL